jgi:hypothetical protein
MSNQRTGKRERMTLHVGKHLIDPNGNECVVAGFNGITVVVDYPDDTWNAYHIDDIDENWKEK